ncbi:MULTISPECIES: enhanced serine sensitivity protein SseB C-terminal domain-containing protein [unclassified Rhodanobacter]|uniref:enhanced serine sensitivity protein SseB C-terminal domain-containing protein n=1 Tax=unclassified Rhodanobacter TaxID=2621553 RepID=UPI002032AA85|nr:MULTISPECIES: enhanced serine sensitivity protein SseB C-terminal domain-containing protein [unclassified Rhodanobacter]
MAKMANNALAKLLAAARTTPLGANSEDAQEAVFKALLDATVYAHVPVESPPEGVMRFIQFVRPDNGQTVLPFFSDKEQSEAAAVGGAALTVAMSGRHLFKLTRGATLMLNPNLDKVTLYPPEIDALLEGRPLGFFTKDEIAEETKVLTGPPSISTAGLNAVLRRLFEREATVRAAFLAEVHRQDERAEIFLLLTVVVAKAHQERLLQLATLAIKSEALQLDLPLSMRFLAPDVPFDELCNSGVQVFGT